MQIIQQSLYIAYIFSFQISFEKMRRDLDKEELKLKLDVTMKEVCTIDDRFSQLHLFTAFMFVLLIYLVK
jgi:hypothetical protein